MATAIPTLPNSSGRALVLGSIGLSCCLSLGAQRHIARNHQQTAFRHDGLGVVVLLEAAARNRHDATLYRSD